MLVEENIELEKAVKEFYELSIRDKHTKIFKRVKLDELYLARLLVQGEVENFSP